MYKIQSKQIFFIVMFFCFTSIQSTVAMAEPQATVAILPFTMHTPSDLHYLQDGIHDMLASRLAWQGKV
jgi:hypothetical protein